MAGHYCARCTAACVPTSRRRQQLSAEQSVPTVHGQAGDQRLEVLVLGQVAAGRSSGKLLGGWQAVVEGLDEGELRLAEATQALGEAPLGFEEPCQRADQALLGLAELIQGGDEPRSRLGRFARRQRQMFLFHLPMI